MFDALAILGRKGISVGCEECWGRGGAASGEVPFWSRLEYKGEVHDQRKFEEMEIGDYERCICMNVCEFAEILILLGYLILEVLDTVLKFNLERQGCTRKIKLGH